MAEKKTTEQFISEARLNHSGIDYSLCEYKGAYVPVKLRCFIHGEFSQTPHNHLKGQGCPACKKERLSEVRKDNMRFSPGWNKSDTTAFISKFNKIFGAGAYNTDEVEYITAHKKVVLTHNVCGTRFEATPNNLLKGKGCPTCGIQKRIEGKTYTQEEFEALANKSHNSKYEYGQYRGVKHTIEVKCPTHGWFIQSAQSHLAGHGCPRCAKALSSGEIAITDYIKSLIGEDAVETRNRIILKGKELDIYIPSKKLAIEYDGLIWHSEKFGGDRYGHLQKMQACNAAGIRLIHIFEDEWLEHPDIVKDKLSYLLGCYTQTPVIGARKCEVQVITKVEAKPFLDSNHIQGYAPASLYLGAYYGDKLVSVMTFLGKDRKWELNRFATDNSIRVPGIASKMFKYFCSHYEYDEVKSFLDLRWNQIGDTIYEKLGFKVEEILPPDYGYVIGETRVHKFNCRKQILSKKYNLPLSMTEKEMCDKLGFYRIWNCGLVKYVYR